MKIAYIISAYKLPEQLVRLVKTLNANGTSFFIHVDKKTDDETYAKMTGPLNGYTNVCFLERHLCNWADFGHVNATLKGLRQALKNEVHFDYVFLLTGQDYPIKSNRSIQEYLQESQGRSFIEYFSIPFAGWSENGGLDRLAYWHFHQRGRHFAFPNTNQFRGRVINRLWNILARRISMRRDMPGNLEPFGGSSYWCLSRECAKYIDEFVRRQQAFVDFFRYVHVPDEIFFQTILLNSRLKESLANDNLWYIDWSKPEPPYPAVLCREDLEQFFNTDKLFARKFDMTVDADVLDAIDKASCETALSK